MEAATTEIVHGVTLEAIAASNLPDTESLLGELGSMYPVVSYPAEAPVDRWDDEDGDAASADLRRDELDETIMAGLLWP